MYVHVALCVHVVLCAWCVVVLLCCGVVWLCGMWHGLVRGKPPRAHVQDASVCTFKAPPCVPARRPHVEHMRAYCRYTRRRFETTHEGVLDMSTMGPISPLLLFFSRPFFFLSSPLFSSLPFSSLLFSFLSLLFSSLLLSSHQQTQQRTRRPTLRRFECDVAHGRFIEIANQLHGMFPPLSLPPLLSSLPPSLPPPRKKKRHLKLQENITAREFFPMTVLV